MRIGTGVFSNVHVCRFEEMRTRDSVQTCSVNVDRIIIIINISWSVENADLKCSRTQDQSLIRENLHQHEGAGSIVRPCATMANFEKAPVIAFCQIFGDVIVDSS